MFKTKYLASFLLVLAVLFARYFVLNMMCSFHNV